jgi:multidrug efflux system membrane fusion protein
MTMDEGTGGERTALEFETDRGASRSFWVAGALLVAVIAWMGSGLLLPPEEPAPAVAQAEAPEAVAVATRVSVAEPVTLTFRAEGQAQPDRDSALRVEASGTVAEVLASKGEEVADGQVIARLDPARVEADVARARAEQSRAERELANAEALLDRGVATADRVAEARAAAASAAAQVATAQDALAGTEIVAPFAGRLETLSLDAGEFVQAGSEVGRIVDNRPLTVALQVPQQSLNRVRSGQTAQVSFITGEVREGTVAFVGTAASAETRTFLAEITVPNADGAIPAGISAKIVIPTGQAEAHFIAPSIVSLAPDGRLGVKAVEDGTVVFHEIVLVRAEVDGIWVTGPPDEVELIVVGQGYVQAGEPVRARPAETAPGATPIEGDAE